VAFKDKNFNRLYQRLWHRRRRAGLPTQLKQFYSDHEIIQIASQTLKLQKLPPEERKRRRLENSKIQNRKVRQRKKELINKKVGDKCYFCGYTKRLVCHRKDGKKHKKFLDMNFKELKKILEDDRDSYVRLCFKCHKWVHWCMERLGMTWEEIEQKWKQTHGSSFS